MRHRSTMLASELEMKKEESEKLKRCNQDIEGELEASKLNVNRAIGQGLNLLELGLGFRAGLGL